MFTTTKPTTAKTSTATSRARSARRLAAPVLVVLTASALAPVPAAAAKPVTSPPTPIADEFVVPAGVACDFDLEVAATGKLGAVLFEDGRGIFTAPGFRMTFSRPGSSEVFTSIATGTFHDQPVEALPDGSFRYRTAARGHNVLFGPFEDGGVTTNAARLYVGNVSLTITVDGATGVATFSHIDARAARVIDICAELS